MSNLFRFVPEKYKTKLQSLKFDQPVKIMEVCGTHTVSIHRYGIQKLLPENVKLVSGPGCPVCVTPDTYINEAIFLAQKGFSIITFGDLMKIPGSHSSLEKERANSHEIRIVYSPLDALTASKNSQKEVVFLSVGFETTVPGIAVMLKQAEEKGVKNISFLTGNKLIPPAMIALIENRADIDGFILPGHVSTIIGKNGYDFLKKYQIPGVISGFEAFDIVTSIIILLEQIKNSQGEVINNYQRVVRDEGNIKSRQLIQEVFTPVDSQWRGLGTIGNSGLNLKANYQSFDIREKIEIKAETGESNPECRCGDVLSGRIDPPQCPLFKKVCHPENPVGPCMVSSEGSCGAWYHYE